MINSSPKVLAKDALALLSLRSAPTSPTRLTSQNQENKFFEKNDFSTTVAKFEGKNFEFLMRQKSVLIGRSSSKGKVDINMEPSSFVSRCHFQVYFVVEEKTFYVNCFGKNGIFVDGVFHKKGAYAQALPEKCVFRFPSTNIKIYFQAMMNNAAPLPISLPFENLKSTSPQFSTPSPTTNGTQLFSTPSNTTNNEIKTPLPPPQTSLKARRNLPPLTIPPNFISPCPSPAGTISAVNSCPSSPRANRMSIEDNGVLSEEVVEDCKDSNGEVTAQEMMKPPFSYAQLIVQAISSQPDHQLTLSGIYSYISKHYPYYRPHDKGWQNSIRHNLSLNRFFVKVPRSQEEPGKGSFWRIEAASEAKLMEQAFKKRKQKVESLFSSNTSNSFEQNNSLSPTSPEATNNNKNLMLQPPNAIDLNPSLQQLLNSQILRIPQNLMSDKVKIIPNTSKHLVFNFNNTANLTNSTTTTNNINDNGNCINSTLSLAHLGNDCIQDQSDLRYKEDVVRSDNGFVKNIDNKSIYNNDNLKSDLINKDMPAIILLNQSSNKNNENVFLSISSLLQQQQQQQSLSQQHKVNSQHKPPQQPTTQEQSQQQLQNFLLHKILQQNSLLVNKISEETPLKGQEIPSSPQYFTPISKPPTEVHKNNIPPPLQQNQQQSQLRQNHQQIHQGQQQTLQIPGGTLHSIPQNIQFLIGASLPQQNVQQKQLIQQQATLQPPSISQVQTQQQLQQLLSTQNDIKQLPLHPQQFILLPSIQSTSKIASDVTNLPQLSNLSQQQLLYTLQQLQQQQHMHDPSNKNNWMNDESKHSVNASNAVKRSSSSDMDDETKKFKHQPS